jgi:hypothetical protein
MPNGKKLIPPSPGPDFALRQSDAEGMQRVMKAATSSRSSGMAHVAATREMAKTKKKKSHPCLDC